MSRGSTSTSSQKWENIGVVEKYLVGVVYLPASQGANSDIYKKMKKQVKRKKTYFLQNSEMSQEEFFNNSTIFSEEINFSTQSGGQADVTFSVTKTRLTHPGPKQPPLNQLPLSLGLVYT